MGKAKMTSRSAQVNNCNDYNFHPMNTPELLRDMASI